MTKDILRYDRMVETAMRGVVRAAVRAVAQHGLPGSHHFYITFKTGAPGVVVPGFLRERYPDEMTIVLEHRFWDLAVTDDALAVTLYFQKQPERLTIPFAAVTDFVDPSVKFRLQFQETGAPAPAAVPGEAKPPAPLAAGPAPAESRQGATPDDKKVAEKKPGEVVALDTFRKK